MAVVQLCQLALVGDHAVTLIHYEGRLSDTVLSVYADLCLVSVFFVADAGELLIYTTPLTRWLILFAGWVSGWSFIQLVIGCNSLAQIHFWLELHHHWPAGAAFYQAPWHVNG